MDYESLGLKCGLEVHQQLDTHKLFCQDASGLSETVAAEFRRRLRPTQSELGEVDAAAIEEARRNLAFVYQATPNSCLVEADEEPPHPCNLEALEVALTMAILLHARVFDEVHFMRKLVIDGSNTTGFQRSALVATDGWLELDGKRYGIPSILLEEDAARKIEDRDGEVVYRLDRLGVPLIEISTTPNIASPDEAAKVALRIGTLLRATRKVKRGIGTIREDLNVSIAGGTRTETKGVQELRMIASYVDTEIARQQTLVEVARELSNRRILARGGRPVSVKETLLAWARKEGGSPELIHDLTDLFASTTSSVVRKALDAGGRVLGVRLPGFAGLLKGKLGPELAAHARIAGVGGILHSDELPGYGITPEDVAQVSARLGVAAGDAFVLVAEAASKGREGLKGVLSRAAIATEGVPPETREPRPDGTTTYARPLPGRARMYPETDVPPIRITKEQLDRLEGRLPELPEIRLERLLASHRIPRQQAAQLVEEGTVDAFEAIVAEAAEPQVVANALTYTFAEVRREGLDVDAIPLERLRDLFRRYAAGAFAKEAIPDLLRTMARDRVDVSTAARSLGLAAMSEAELDAALDAIVAAHEPMIRERGERALAALMGVAMGQLRGKADGRVINEKLRAKIAAKLDAGGGR